MQRTFNYERLLVFQRALAFYAQVGSLVAGYDKVYDKVHVKVWDKAPSAVRYLRKILANVAIADLRAPI